MHCWLDKLTLINFKNYSEKTFEFCPKINCFTGNNGAGKTNILDAIHYLSLCKSYFTNIDTQNIKYDETFFSISGEYQKSEKIEQIFCGVKKDQKKIFKRNSKEYEKLADHIGFIPLVIVSPSDSTLITEGSEERRRFIDTVLSQFDGEYLNDMLRYNRALAQRNLLLKDFDIKRWFDPDMIAMWDEQLIDTGTRVYEKRKSFLNEIIPDFQKYYQFISEGAEVVDLAYDSQLINLSFQELLNNNLAKDRKLLYTSGGIHKDDISLKLGNYPIKRSGSQGQQKTYLVALKLAQFDFIKKNTQNCPILLLDDIFDKFDISRVNKILELVSENNFGQIFITDTNYIRMTEILEQTGVEHRHFQIQNDTLNTSL
jgi:DNA replication and repair protein RecF